MLNIIFVIIVVGVLLWLVHYVVPMDVKVRKILDVVVIGALVIWLLKVFGILARLKGL